MSSKSANFKKNQTGLALLVFIVAVFLAVSTYYFSSISIVAIKTDKIEKTQAVLKRAKQALLAYAQIDWNAALKPGRIGKLPCPDLRAVGSDGEQDSPCGLAYSNAVGYFPWRTLGMEITKDSSGSCLLYAVSPAYKVAPVAALNPDSYGQFLKLDNTGAIIQGLLPEERPVAIIIAPQATLPGQVRETIAGVTCGSYYGNNIFNLMAAYLDSNGVTNNAAMNPGVNNNIDEITSAYAGSAEAANPINDRVITISHREFWDALDQTITSAAFDTKMKNLTEAITLCFARYGFNNGSRLPMPANLSLAEYRRSADYIGAGLFNNGYSGRLPYNVSLSNAEIGNGDLSNIFSNAYCDGLDLRSTDTVESINFSNVSGSDNGEYFDLWSNWKDYFFYAISKDFNPSSSAICSGNCINVGASQYAGAVFFSGIKLAGQTRYSPPFDPYNKQAVANYLENNNAIKFPDNMGNANYNTVGGGSNDVMFCIKTNMSVNECL